MFFRYVIELCDYNRFYNFVHYVQKNDKTINFEYKIIRFVKFSNDNDYKFFEMLKTIF